MNWMVVLTYEDGTTENMYCTTRNEARECRRRYLQNSLSPDTIIGKRLVSADVQRVGA